MRDPDPGGCLLKKSKEWNSNELEDPLPKRQKNSLGKMSKRPINRI